MDYEELRFKGQDSQVGRAIADISIKIEVTPEQAEAVWTTLLPDKSPQALIEVYKGTLFEGERTNHDMASMLVEAVMLTYFPLVMGINKYVSGVIIFTAIMAQLAHVNPSGVFEPSAPPTPESVTPASLLRGLH